MFTYICGSIILAIVIVLHLKELVATLGILVAIYVGVEGLKTWKRQMKGNANYEVSRAILRGAYRTRNSIKLVRRPGMMGSIHNPQELSQEFQKRLEQMNIAYSELETAQVEGEVLWGASCKEATEGLHKVIKKLYLAINIIISPDIQANKDNRDTVYEGDENDNLNKELNAAVTTIEQYTKKYMER